MWGTLALPVALLAVVTWRHLAHHPSGPEGEFLVAIGIALAIIATGIWRMLSVVRARDRFEADLWETEEQFRIFFDESPVGMSMTAPEGRLQRVNRAFCTMLGYARHTWRAWISLPSRTPTTWPKARKACGAS